MMNNNINNNYANEKLIFEKNNIANSYFPGDLFSVENKISNPKDDNVQIKYNNAIIMMTKKIYMKNLIKFPKY